MSEQDYPRFDTTLTRQNAALFPVEDYDELKGLDEQVAVPLKSEAVLEEISWAPLQRVKAEAADVPVIKKQAARERRRRRGARSRRALRASGGPRVSMF